MSQFTKNDWWKWVDDNWSHGLEELVRTFYSGSCIPEMSITAPNVEVARQVLISKNEVLDYDQLIKSRDIKMLDVFNSTYHNIPESLSCWEYPKFGLLCDLCSESYVLYDEEEFNGD